MLSPPPHPLFFCRKLREHSAPLLLADSREFQELAARFHWTTGGDNRWPASIGQQAERMIQMRALGDTHIP
jgi:hypothetical protein